MQRATQSIQLTGLGTPFFDKVYDGMARLYYLFNEHIGNSVIPLPEPIPNRDRFISAANRIFKARPIGSSEPHVPFNYHEDPFDVLNKTAAMSTNYFRPEHLVVKYMDAREWVASRDA
jgi:hypothetical protein